MSLRSDIKAWDCKSADSIRALYGRHAGSGAFASKLVELAGHTELQRGSTWLLKHHFEDYREIPSEDVARDLYRLVAKLEHWESRLHVLQCMQYIPVPANCTQQVIKWFLASCLAEEQKFVRAWAYSGSYELAMIHPKYRDEAMVLLEDAIETESAASVLARVRRFLRKGFPET